MTKVALSHAAFGVVLAMTAMLQAQVAGTQPKEPEAVVATGVRAGLAVVLPATDGAELTALSCDGRFVVQGLQKEALLDGVRKGIPSSMHGLVSAQSFAGGPTLSYADNLVDLLVIDRDALGADAPTEAEALRVIAPGYGAIWQRSGGKWSKLTKPMPATYGEWSHYFGDATNNPVSKDRAIKVPTGLQWITGSRGNMEEGTQMVESGKYIGSFRNLPNPGYYLSARGAFNGIGQWRTTGEGKSMMGRFGPMAMAHGFLYMMHDAQNGPVVEIDGTTGRVIRKFEIPLADFSNPVVKGLDGKEVHLGRFAGLSVCGEDLVVWRKTQIFCVSRSTGKLRWTFDAGKVVEFVSHDIKNKRLGMLLGLDNQITLRVGRAPSFKPGEIASVNLSDGSLAWRIPYPNPERNRVEAFLAHEGSLYFHNGLGLDNAGITIGAIDGADGKVRWLKANLTRWAGHDMHPAMGIGSLMVYPEAVVLARSAVVIFDPLDGRSKGEWSVGNSRCDNGRGDANGFANFGHYFRFDGKHLTATRNEIARNPCGGANLPAYGMHYYQPQVCGCFAAVRGLLALSSQPVLPPTPDSERLIKGPAYGQKSTLVEGQGDWPALLHDSARSARGTGLKTSAIKEVWRVTVDSTQQPGAAAADWRDSANYNGPLSAPVIAGGLLIVAAPDAHRIHAIDAATGKPRWTVTTGSRVDTPPTVSGGRIYAGCRDGWLYCFDLATGQLAWKFMAARAPKTIVAYDQPESAWPVHGSVLVESNTVVATAGYHPDADGGIHCWGLDPVTGNVRWKRVVASVRPTLPMDPAETGIPGFADYFSSNQVLNSVPNSDGKRVILPGLRLTLQTGEVEVMKVGGKARKVVKGDEAGHDMSLSTWGLNDPWLRSAKGGFDGPGNTPERQSIQAAANGPPLVRVWGRRLAWDEKRVLQVSKTDIGLFVHDRSQTALGAGNAQLPGPGEKPRAGISIVRLKFGRMEKRGWGSEDCIAMVLAENRAAIAWSSDQPKQDRSESILQIVDVDGKTQPEEIIVKPGIIDHGMATAHQRLYVVLEDGSIAAFE